MDQCAHSLWAAHKRALQDHLSLSRVDLTSMAFNGGLAPPSHRRIILLCSRLRSFAVSASTMPNLHTGTAACTCSRPTCAELAAAHAAATTCQSHTSDRCTHTSDRHVQLGHIVQPVTAACCSKVVPCSLPVKPLWQVRLQVGQEKRLLVPVHHLQQAKTVCHCLAEGLVQVGACTADLGRRLQDTARCTCSSLQAPQCQCQRQGSSPI